MKCAARVALGVAGGYFLGRTKKMKLALMLAGTAAGRQAGGPAAALLGQGGAGALLGQGKKILDASPELSRLVDEVRGRLLEAGKGAALAVAARQVESLTDRVARRAESSLSNLAERGRSSTNSSQADDDLADEDIHNEADDGAEDEVEDEVAGNDEVEDAGAGDDQEQGAGGVDGDEQDEATAGWADDAHTNAAAGRACRSAGDPAAATSGTRTAVRRSTGVASGARRSAEKAAGRPARTRGRNGNG